MNNKTRRLFVDDFHISALSKLKRTMHQVEKHPANPLIKPDRPWEGLTIWAMNSAIYDEKERLFKLWYHFGERTALAVSSDGVRWEKPDLGLVEYEGSKKNNLIDRQIFHILYGQDDFGALSSDQLYKTVCWSQQMGQHVKASADGLRWQEIGKCEVFGAGDTFLPIKSTTPLTGQTGELPGYPGGASSRYLGVARWCMGVGRFDGSSDLRPSRRVQGLLTSSDLLKWGNPVRILTPDALDDAMAQERIEAALVDGSLVHDCKEDRRCEFYNMLIIPYEDLYLGYLLIFDPSYEFHRVGKNNQAGPGEAQLVVSRDLVDWQRLGDRKPFIPRGGRGQFDWAMAWYSSLPIVKDGKLWFFYVGNCTTHGGTRDEAYWNGLIAKTKTGEIPAICSLGLATLRRDGFISLDAGTEPGYVLTKPFAWPENEGLFLNADVRSGEVRVEVCQPDGTPYEGYEMSDALKGDLLEAQVRWPGGRTGGSRPRHTHGTDAEAGVVSGDEYRTLRPGKMARLKIQVQNGKLYSYWFK
jgi:hypothetical protein